MREPNLLAWQWSLYSGNHRNRTNLIIHILTVPLFITGTLTMVVGPAMGHPLFALAGPPAMVAAMAAQGRGHRMEAEAPVPFDGPVDVAARIFAEQLLTFPRYVLSGGFLAAWRKS